MSAHPCHSEPLLAYLIWQRVHGPAAVDAYLVAAVVIAHHFAEAFPVEAYPAVAVFEAYRPAAASSAVETADAPLEASVQVSLVVEGLFVPSHSPKI